jgi:thiamine biosynthesis lipoprotein
MAFHNLTAALLGGAAALVAPAHGGAVQLFHADHVLGTSLDAVIVSASARLAELAFARARAEIARLDLVLSGWRGDSELAALNSAGRHAASPDLYNVIAAGEAWRLRSGGAFSLAPAFAGPPLVLEDGRRIVRPAGMTLNVDAIAKGYIIDRAMAAARSVPGIDGVMIDIGGDLCCSGMGPTGKAWRVGVADPFQAADNAEPFAFLALNHGAVASSGSFLRGHAILDPMTGARSNDVAMATAVAASAMDADALATIFHVLPAEKALALADDLPGVAAHIILGDGTVAASKGWERLAQAAPPRPAAAASAWPAGFSVKIDYVVPRFTSSLRLYPPYVTIWVTNAAGEPVRSLVFHAARERYMRENYVFWERIGRDNPKLVDAITRPTRGPGAYSFTWDGRDDNRQPLPLGRYTINIEASREGGGH